MLRPAPAPGLMDFVHAPQGFEIVRYTIYSRKTLAAVAVPASTLFFADQAGSGGITLRDTNMKKPSAIGNPNRFLAQWLNCQVYNKTAAEGGTTNAASDANVIIHSTTIRIELMDKEYLTVPTWFVPAGGGIWSQQGIAAATQFTNGEADRNNGLRLELPLECETIFRVYLLNDMPTSIALANATMQVEISMTGLLLRGKQ